MRSGRGALRSSALLRAVKRVCASHVPEDGRRAVMAFGPRALGYGGQDDVLFVLLVADKLGVGVRLVKERALGMEMTLIIAGRSALEGDVRRGVLGELLADKFLLPYVAIEGRPYLADIELKLKKRLVRELLMDIAYSFPKIATEMLIDPRYFLYEIVSRMGRLTPASAYAFANLLAHPRDRAENEQTMLKGFLKALEELRKEGLVVRDRGFYRPTERLVKKASRPKLFSLLWRVRAAARSISRYALRILYGLRAPYESERQVFMRRFARLASTNPLSVIPRPEDFLFLRTAIGLRPALKEATLDELSSSLGLTRGPDDIDMREIGGTVNLVYLVTVRGATGLARFIVKYFRDWKNLTWLSLRLWALGAKKFAISGRERLKREYVMCRELASLGFPVPRIFHVNLRAGCLVEEFIEGVNFSDILRRFFLGEEEAELVLKIAEEAGRLLADIHKAGISVGDFKPENLIAKTGGGLGLVDLEQATRGGDKAWDVAEFLFYSGHYVPSISTAEEFELMARAFLRGYVGAGGPLEAVRKAPSAKFVRVFSVFTPPQVIDVINKLCEGVGP